MLSELLKYAHAISHLRRAQIIGRLSAPLRRIYATWGSLRKKPGCLRSSIENWDHFPTRQEEGFADVSSGEISLLNTTKQLGRPVEWQPDASLLWQFNLHYFNYLSALSQSLQKAICKEWIEANSVGQNPGWHPYPTSLRVINWCKAGFEEQDILRSLYQQAAYLYRHLETHLLGNHLLENARALVFAGRFFGKQGEAPSWLERGLAVYRKQTPEQILGDGGHFERSPMYHALMLEGYVDVLNLLPRTHPDHSWLADTVRRMSDFLVSMTHPNGHIALFNDATREIAPPTERLVEYVNHVLGYQPTQRSQFGETGFYVHRESSTYLVIDGGPIGPDYLPAHAHADIFSYELSIEGIPFIVDAGVFEYEAGEMRNYVRSTKAHNTVSVDEVDQVECWDSFRVARRYAPHDVSFNRKDSQSVFKGIFSGYQHLIGDGIEHQRCMEVDGAERKIAIKDKVRGRGQHSVVSRIHLHPEVQVQQGRGIIRLSRRGREVQISTGDSQVQLEKGWYCPEFGIRKLSTVVVLGGEQNLPANLNYTLRY